MSTTATRPKIPLASESEPDGPTPITDTWTDFVWSAIVAIVLLLIVLAAVGFALFALPVMLIGGVATVITARPRR